jgi:threonylcarbamoyladenosine tRNA methylthiotransferase MtaB
MQVAITGCGTLERGTLIAESAFFSLYPELVPYKENIELLPEKTPPLGLSPAAHQNNVYTKHFVLIQNGCDNHCSFCLTVMKRGKHRSRPLKDIIQEIQQIEIQGGKEIVLTGVNLMARGATHTRNPAESRFSELLEAILQETTIPRIRISSI